MDDIRLINVDVREIVQSVHSSGRETLIGQGWFRSQAIHCSNIVNTSGIVKLVPVQWCISPVQSYIVLFGERTTTFACQRSEPCSCRRAAKNGYSSGISFGIGGSPQA